MLVLVILHPDLYCSYIISDISVGKIDFDVELFDHEGEETISCTNTRISSKIDLLSFQLIDYQL